MEPSRLFSRWADVSHTVVPLPPWWKFKLAGDDSPNRYGAEKNASGTNGSLLRPTCLIGPPTHPSDAISAMAAFSMVA